MRSAGLPRESRDTPMIRPGILREYVSVVARKAACGPPNPYIPSYHHAIIPSCHHATPQMEWDGM